MVNNKKGVTLTELMITVAIIGIMASVGGTVFTKINEFFLLNQSRTEVQRDSRLILSLVNRNLRQASSNSIVISKQTGQPPYSRIRFVTQAGTEMSFYQSNNNLIMTSGTMTKTLSTNLRYIAFSLPMSDDMTIVSISLTMEKLTYRGMTKAMHLAVEKVRVMNE